MQVGESSPGGSTLTQPPRFSLPASLSPSDCAWPPSGYLPLWRALLRSSSPFAIFLTGSKGGVSLGLPLGTIAFAVCLSRSKGGAMATLVTISLVLTALIGVLFLKNVGWLGLAISGLFAIAVIALTGDRPSRKNQCIRLASTYVAAFVLVLLLSISTAAKTDAPAPVSSVKGSAQISTPVPAATPIARIAQGGGSQEQSATFRLNLWKSALHLIKSRPLTGYGMGSYRYESARAGLTTSTVFAHNTFLQIWAEGGIVSFGLILAGIAVWFLTVLKNRSQLPIARLAPFAGIVAAVIALLAHSMVDSDLYYFGIGICFFCTSRRRLVAKRRFCRTRVHAEAGTRFIWGWPHRPSRSPVYCRSSG